MKSANTLSAKSKEFVNQSVSPYLKDNLLFIKIKHTMKKTLMVLTFALCATFVFAQTMTPRAKELKAMSSVKHAAVSQNNSGSSIFTKDVELLYVDFSDGTKTGNVWTGTNYTTGYGTFGDDAHGQTYDYTFWQRWEYGDDAQMTQFYPYLGAQWEGQFSDICDTVASTSKTGYMFLPALEQRSGNTGTYNVFIQFASVDASDASVVDVQFYQNYYKYYDKTYMDYSLNDGTSWVPVEINVTGVDMEVNTRLVGTATYTLPLAAAGRSNLKVRLRFNAVDGYQAYGYWWLVDDVRIIAGPADRLTTYGQEFVEGNYGIIPQNMTINPAWYAQVKNSGSNVQSNLTVALATSLVAEEDLQPFATQAFPQINAGADAMIYCDNGGWLFLDSLEYRGWYGYITSHTPHAAAGSTALPTANVGDYYLGASITNANVTKNYDTMFYTVRGAETELNGGYRWAHDNGLLTYAPKNVWVYGYVQVDGEWYVTDDPEEVDFYTPGYRATSRYTTDAVVPEGWVIRGVEMVASPANGYYSTGAQISPVLLTDQYEGGSVRFMTLNTGAGVYTVTANDINDSTIIGRTPGRGYRNIGEYNTIYIPFPEQPALQANTSYRIGYLIESEAFLAMAQEAHGSYREASPSRPEQYDTILYFKNNSNMKQYSHFMTPNKYQSYVMDPINSEEGGTFAHYADYNPMIRMIVGPEMAVTRYNVEINCNGSEFGEVGYNSEDACNDVIRPAEHSTFDLTLLPSEGCIVTELKVDGEVVTPYDEATDEGDEDFVMVETQDGVIYYYTFRDITADHTVEVTFAEDGSEPEAIDPVAAAVRMNLQPNPATSQVSLNIEGVEGMVNCSIIDMSGRVVYNADMNAQNAQVINLNSLAKGAYFVRVTNSNFTKVEKLIVR